MKSSLRLLSLIVLLANSSILFGQIKLKDHLEYLNLLAITSGIPVPYLYQLDVLDGAYIPNQLVVTFPLTVSQSDRDTLRKMVNATVIEKCGCETIETWDIGNQDLTAIQEQVKGAAVKIKGQSSEDSIVVSKNYYYGNIVEQINGTRQNGNLKEMIERIPISNPETSVKVGQLDTGIDFAHPNLYQYVWKNPTELFWSNGDENGNCYKADALGWNFVSDNNNVWDDSNTGHGSHVAGILVQNAKMGNVPIKIVSAKVLDNNGVGVESHLACGIRYLTDEGVKIINGSLGRQGLPSEIVQDAIAYAERYCVPIVFSAGNIGTDNDSYPNWPSNYDNDNIIAVNAINDNLTGLWKYSNLASKPQTVDIAAKGENIYSTVSGGTYTYKSGTSMAAPVVTAGIAFLAYRNVETCQEAKKFLLQSSIGTELKNNIHGFFDMERLVTTYKDGLHYYFPHEIIFNKNSYILPNPVVSNATVHVNVLKEGDGILLLSNTNGEVLGKESVMLYTGKNEIDLHLEKVNPGVYILHVYQNSNRIDVIKVIKL